MLSRNPVEISIRLLRSSAKEVSRWQAKELTAMPQKGWFLPGVSDKGDFGALIVLNSETDFVAKNEGFIKFAQDILNLAVEKRPADLAAMTNLIMGGRPVGDRVTEQVGIIGEKLDLSFYARIEASQVIPYIQQRYPRWWA
jgi:elongation factor Ts